jgi:hypothetical protein
MTPFSEWARQRQNSGESGRDSESDEPADVVNDLIAGLEQSLRYSEAARHWQLVGEAQEHWMRQAAEARNGALDSRIAEIEDRLASSVEAALTPLLKEALVKKGIEEFCTVLQRHLQSATGFQPTISAPMSWRKILDDELDASGITATIEEKFSGEVSATVDDTEIETDICSWFQRLRQEAA